MTDAEVRREAQREQVAALQRERHGGALRESAESHVDVESIRPRAAECALAKQGDHRQRHGDDGIHGHPPRERDDADRVREDAEDGQAGDAAEREAGRGGPVAVERRERTRRKCGKQLPERRRDENDHRARGDLRRRVWKSPRDQVTDLMREHADEQGDRHGEREHGEGIRTNLAAEAAGLCGTREIRYDDHAERLRREHEHEVDAVRRHEAVRLGGAPELVGEQRARAGGGKGDHDLREAGEETAPQCATAPPDAHRGRAHRRIKAETSRPYVAEG